MFFNLQHLPYPNPTRHSMKPNTIPVLFLISVYMDNEWDPDVEESLLTFLVQFLTGKLGLVPPSLESFLDLISQNNLNVELNSFLRDQIPKLLESIIALEQFLKEVSTLIDAQTESVMTISPNSLFGLFIKKSIAEYEAMSFDQASRFFDDLCIYCETGMYMLIRAASARVRFDRIIH